MTMVHASLAPAARASALAEHVRLPVRPGRHRQGGKRTAAVVTGQLTVFGPGDAFTVEADGRQDTRTGTFELLFLGGRPIGEPVACTGPS